MTDNGSPVASDFEAFTITVGNVNRPPVLTNPGNQAVAEGQLLTIALTASDPDGDLLVFSSSTLPNGASLVPGLTNGTATFSWTPAAGQASATPYSVTVTATDPGGQFASQTFTITVGTVGNVNQPPTVTNPGNKTVTAGQVLSFTITGSDPDVGNTLSFSAGATLPSGATLNAATGAFSWTPTTGQASSTPYSVTVTATDNGNPPLTSAPVTFTITVNAPASPRSPSPASPPPRRARRLPGRPSPSPPRRPGAPPPISSSGGSGTGAPGAVARDWATGNTLTWTPTAPGNYELHAWVRNSGVTADTWQAWGRLPYTVTAAPTASLPTVTSVTATQASPQAAGTPITLTATATGGTAPYQFKWWVWNGSAWSRRAGLGHGQHPHLDAHGPRELRAPRLGPQQRRDRGHLAGLGTPHLHGDGCAPASLPTMTSVTANRTGIRPVGRSVTLTATATGGTAPYQFKWWVWNGSAWTVAREWATGNTLTWTPTAPGTYEIHAWVRNTGVTADTSWQAWGRMVLTVAPQVQVEDD